MMRDHSVMVSASKASCMATFHLYRATAHDSSRRALGFPHHARIGGDFKSVADGSEYAQRLIQNEETNPRYGPLAIANTPPMDEPEFDPKTYVGVEWVLVRVGT